MKYIIIACFAFLFGGCIPSKRKIDYEKGNKFVIEKNIDSLKAFLDAYSPSDIEKDSTLSFFEAYIFLSENKLEDAISSINKSISRGRNVNNLHLAGMIYAAKGDTLSAINSIQDALEIFPDFPSSLNLLGLIYTNIGKYDEAEMLYRKALHVYPNDPEYNANISKNFIKQEQYDSGMRYISLALKFEQNNSDYNFTKGYCYIKQSNDSALYYLNKAINITPQNPKYLYYRGLYYSKINEKLKACNDLDECINLGGFGNAIENRRQYCQ